MTPREHPEQTDISSLQHRSETHPEPLTLAEAWAMFEGIQDSHNQRQRDGAGPMLDETRARLRAAVTILDTQPAPTLMGVRIRAGWLWEQFARGIPRAPEKHMACLAQLMADIDTLRAAAAFQSKVETSRNPADDASNIYTGIADKRAAVVALLGSPEGADLSNREIARRLKISPTTVSNLRSKGLT